MARLGTLRRGGMGCGCGRRGWVGQDYVGADTVRQAWAASHGKAHLSCVHGKAGVARIGETWRGGLWTGRTRLRQAWPGRMRFGEARRGKAGMAGSVTSRHGEIRGGTDGRGRQGTASRDSVGQGPFRRGRRGLARRGMCSVDLAWQARQGRERKGRIRRGRHGNAGQRRARTG